jgi:allantoin racemase
MNILIFNPNTSDTVTERMRKEAKKFERHGLSIDVRKAPRGPQGIETAYDEVVAAYVTMEELKRLEDQYDAFVIGCFADPGLAAAREVIKVPVVGLCEASLHTACLNGGLFSIISSCGSDDIYAFIETVKRYGLRELLASVRYLGTGVNGVSESIMDEIKTKIRQCVSEDGARTVILGCAAFAGFGDMLTKELGIPVIDGIKASIYFAKMMVEWNADGNSK